MVVPFCATFCCLLSLMPDTPFCGFPLFAPFEVWHCHWPAPFEVFHLHPHPLSSSHLIYAQQSVSHMGIRKMGLCPSLPSQHSAVDFRCPPGMHIALFPRLGCSFFVIPTSVISGSLIPIVDGDGYCAFVLHVGTSWLYIC